MARGTTKPFLRRRKHETAVKNWLDLPNDLTLMIFSRLATFDILTGVQQVCRQWRSICMDPLMWRTINMCDIGMYNSLDYNVWQMCRHAIDRSCGQLEDISIEYFGSDCILKYIIDSQCKLRRLRLVQCFYTIFDEGLCEIAQKLPLLEELEITLCKHVTSVALEAIGQCCPILKSLKFNHNDYNIDNKDAFAIAQNMPNLRHLQLVNSCLDNDGVSAILDGCRFLESLDLRWCHNVNLEGRLRKMCDEQLKYFIEPNTPEGFPGYKFGKRCNAYWYDDLTYSYRSRKEWFGDHITENEPQDNGESSEEDEEEEEEVTTDWDEIYDIGECTKNQRSRKVFQRYLRDKKKEKKKNKKNDKSIPKKKNKKNDKSIPKKKKHGRKEAALVTTKAYVLCFDME
ncbi:hypothetical protein HN51_029912 [Arachis hypogaea]|nr:F-box protein [Arachis hypogaea]